MSITISHHNSLCIVDCMGGKIKELVLEGHKVLGTYPRIDGKVGSTHVCVPNFADEGTRTYGLPSHGPARTSMWRMSRQTATSIEIILRIPASDKYPSDLVVSQKFEIRDMGLLRRPHRLTPRNDETEECSFGHIVTVENAGNKEVPVNIAIHNYFDTPQGWRGTQLNGQDITEQISADTYFGALHENVIAFPSAPRISLLAENSGHITVWTGRKEGVYDSAYACIEPVYRREPTYFGSPTSMLQPGKERTISQKIALE